LDYINQIKIINLAIKDGGNNMKNIRYYVCALLAGTSFATSAMAQDVGQNNVDKSNSDSSSKSDDVGEIVVTAQRVSQSIQKVPIAITALSSRELEGKGIGNSADIKAFVPNLYVEHNYSNPSTPQIFMRGIGQANSVFSFDSPVGFYVDDVYYARQTGSLVELFDIDRIEVLRGPQGTIYGRNSSIGAIRVVTQKPPLDHMDLKADITYGTKNQVNSRLDVGVPIIDDKLGFRFAFITKNNDGFQTNLVNGEKADSDDLKAGRAQLYYKASGNFSAILRGDYLIDRSHHVAATNPLTNPDPMTFNSELSYAAGTDRSRTETFGSSLTLNWNLGGAKITSITAWRGVQTLLSSDADATAAAIFEVRTNGLDQRQFTQEVFASGSSVAGLPIDWVAGAFYLRERSNFDWSLLVFTPPSSQKFRQVVSSGSGYIQGTFHVTPKLGLTGGTRYTEEIRDFDVVGTKNDGSFDFSFSDHGMKHKKWTWRAALEYQAFDNILLYASAATGFRSGGLNGNAQTMAAVTSGAFGPEDTLMYEGGIKSSFLSGRLKVNAAYFDGKYNNLQVGIVRSDGTVTNENNNARVHGLELEVKAVPLYGLEFSANLGTLSNNIIGSNLKLTNAPKLNWRLGGSYSHEVDGVGRFTIGGDYSWTDSTFSSADNNMFTQVPSHEQITGYIRFNSSDDHWQLSLVGYNLTDKVYSTGGFFLAGGIVATSYPSLPRRWALSAQYKF